MEQIINSVVSVIERVRPSVCPHSHGRIS